MGTISTNKNFCPFIKDICRNDCVFKHNNVALPNGNVSNCLIAIKLTDINEMQHDDITDILNEITKR